MIHSFEQVWRMAEGESKSSLPELVESLQEKISEHEILASKLFHAEKFETLTSVDQERNAFLQALYGLQNLPFLGIGDEHESEIWKAAREKRMEMDKRADIEKPAGEGG